MGEEAIPWRLHSSKKRSRGASQLEEAIQLEQQSGLWSGARTVGRALREWMATMMHHRATPAAAAASTITATASAIAAVASATVISAADATCHHPRPSTAGRWTPSLITAGASSTVLGALLAARSTAAVTAKPSAAPSRGWRWSSPYPFERRAARPLTNARSTVRAQILRELCGSSITASAALGALGRGRSAGRGRGRRPPTCCVHAAARMRSCVRLTKP